MKTWNSFRNLLKENVKYTLETNLGKKINKGCGAETKELTLEDHKGRIRGCEEFEYFEVKIDKENRHGNHIMNRISKGGAIRAMLNGYCGTGM